MQLTPEAVRGLMKACAGTGKVAEGIMVSYSFDPGRIAEHSTQIRSLLAELPDEFQLSGGGGWSFLNACLDRHGRQWCDLHATMEALFCLGIADGSAKWLLEREMWDAFPGGVPFAVVTAPRPASAKSPER